MGGDFSSGGRTRIWGFRPPGPPLRSGTPPLKLPCVRIDLCGAECGIRSILDLSWRLIDRRRSPFLASYSDRLSTLCLRQEIANGYAQLSTVNWLMFNRFSIAARARSAKLSSSGARFISVWYLAWSAVLIIQSAMKGFLGMSGPWE